MVARFFRSWGYPGVFPSKMANSEAFECISTVKNKQDLSDSKCPSLSQGNVLFSEENSSSTFFERPPLRPKIQNLVFLRLWLFRQ